MKSLTATTLYKIYSKNKVLDLTKFVLSFNTRTDVVDLKYLEGQLEIIRKRFNFPLKNNIIQEIVVNEMIRFYHSPYKASLPSFIPAMLMMDNNIHKVIALGNINRLVTNVDESKGVMKIEPLKLFSIAMGAYVLLKYKTLESAITVSQPILINGASCYSSMVSKVLDKDYAISTKTDLADKIKFLLAIFFLINMIGKEDINDNMIFIAKKCTSVNFSERTAQSLAGTSDLVKSCVNLKSFFSFLNEKILVNESSFNIRAFIQSYLKMYGPNTLFSLEYAPYFMWTLFNVSMSLNMNNQFVLDPLLGKTPTDLLVAFSNIMR